MKLQLADGGQFAKLIAAVIAGDISPVGKAVEAGISGLLFTSTDMRHWLRQQSLTTEVLSVVEAAANLGIKQEVAYSLVRHGHLSAKNIAVGRGAQWLITKKNIDLFASTYVDAKTVAKSWSTSPRWMLDYLKSLEIYPITGPSVDGCRQYFYRRQDLKDVVLIRVSKATSE